MLSASPVVGALYPGDDRYAEVFAGVPHVAVLDVTDLEAWESWDIYVDDALFVDPHVEKSVGLFDLSARRIEIVVFTTTQPFKFSEPFDVTETDLVRKHEFDEGPPSVLVMPAESCPSPDDLPN